MLDLNTHNLTTWVISVCTLAIVVSPCAGKPLDSKAAEEIRSLEALIKLPMDQRSVSGEQVDRWLLLTQEDNSDLRLVVVLCLAYANDTVSYARLEQFAKATSDPILSGAAAYSLVVRRTRDTKKNNLLGELHDRLLNAANPYERMFLANRIAVDFGSGGLPLIVNAVKREVDEVVKCDMMYYIAKADVALADREVLNLKWDETVRLPENLAFVLGSITPNRSKDQDMNSTIKLLSDVRARQEKARRDEGEAP
jgi:hypothetical protein